MASLEELLSNINSGAVDVTVSDAVKRQPRKPKAPTDFSKRLRGQAAATPAAVATAAAGGGIAAAGGGGPPPLAPDAPLTMRLKRVLDLLRLNRDAHTFADIRTKLHVDLSVDSELLDQLSSHSHVTYDTIHHTLRYRPKGASSAVPMTGVRVADIADAYLAIMDDIKRLQAEGSVYVFGNTTASGDVVYAVQNMNIGPVSESVVEMFHNTRLPVDIVELQWRARDLGLKSALATRPKKKKRRKVERKFNVDKATNAHMRELFEGAQPTNIDTR
ncbi:hypothetical protein VOLCADRAFT_116761 [Volvox carteri f. nagariensis]|uniref:Uncharacterized protein n=1 Tax=Volvox carteri f. nagariensis TaxID=3068 RepID=D8TPA8_VOLCA|nr:uncharacterized protein VOLCADRAFT_116761 [Volvox carteri f. nagariensis]EFJ50726.1 hypothetical protein VOLCADRAFT_116761 [Volvox carteri f. nagariensis]|eukprot:XP_002948319.1 hypothetical protein VOLCADRAFT_116761 [Volvox carteri f. nagariensis]